MWPKAISFFNKFPNLIPYCYNFIFPGCRSTILKSCWSQDSLDFEEIVRTPKSFYLNELRLSIVITFKIRTEKNINMHLLIRFKNNNKSYFCIRHYGTITGHEASGRVRTLMRKWEEKRQIKSWGYSENQFNLESLGKLSWVPKPHFEKHLDRHRVIVIKITF